jgi:hypothetical protein
MQIVVYIAQIVETYAKSKVGNVIINFAIQMQGINKQKCKPMMATPLSTPQLNGAHVI